jgi:hypothetical protein
MTRAHILLKADQDPGRSAWPDDGIAGALNVLLGKGDAPRRLELSLRGPMLEARPLRQRANCPTGSPRGRG